MCLRFKATVPKSVAESIVRGAAVVSFCGRRDFEPICSDSSPSCQIWRLERERERNIWGGADAPGQGSSLPPPFRKKEREREIKSGS